MSRQGPTISKAKQKTVITAAVAAGILAAAGTAASPGTPSSAPGAIHTPSVATSSASPALAALVTPNSLLAAVTNPPTARGFGPVAVFAPAGGNASTGAAGGGGLVGGPATAPVGDGGGSATASGPNFTAPTIFAHPTPTGGGSIPAVGGPTLMAAAIPDPTAGLVSPTGAFLGLIGPGGLLIGDGVLPGQNGGLLFGNGAPGGPDQRGGNGGIIGNGGIGGLGQDGGNAGLIGNGGDGGNAVLARAAMAATAA